MTDTSNGNLVNEAVAAAQSEFAAATALDPATGKRGYQTSEFWMHVLVVLVGCALVVYGMVRGSDLALSLGTGLVGVDSAAYKLTRAVTKAVQAPAPAPKVVRVAS